jgi:hypothetical protein
MVSLSIQSSLTWCLSLTAAPKSTATEAFFKGFSNHQGPRGRSTNPESVSSELQGIWLLAWIAYPTRDALLTVGSQATRVPSPMRMPMARIAARSTKVPSAGTGRMPAMSDETTARRRRGPATCTRLTAIEACGIWYNMLMMGKDSPFAGLSFWTHVVPANCGKFPPGPESNSSFSSARLRSFSGALDSAAHRSTACPHSDTYSAHGIRHPMQHRKAEAVRRSWWPLLPSTPGRYR